MGYKFSVWEFTSEEIDQIVEISTAMLQGGNGCAYVSYDALDLRKVSKHVFAWGKNHRIFHYGADMDTSDYGEFRYLRHSVQTKGKRRYFVSLTGSGFDGLMFFLLHDLPPEALFRLVRPVLDNQTGKFTTIHHKGWKDLGLYCASDKEWDYRDVYLQEAKGVFLTMGESKYTGYMMSVLNRLATYGYIIFQYAGSVWQITRTYDQN